MKRVLFSQKRDWQANIVKRLADSNYVPTFLPFHSTIVPDYDLVVPMTIQDIRVLQSDHAALNGRRFLVPAPAALRLANVKTDFNAFLVASGYARHLPRPPAAGEFPYILKKAVDESGANAVLVPDAAAEARLLGDREQQKGYFRQAYVPGTDEYATHMLMCGRGLRFHATVRYVFDQERFIHGRQHRYRSAAEFHDTPFLALFTEILERMAFQGICCFDYKVDAGTPKIFELNPRYGGSLTRFLARFMPAYESCFPRS